MTLTIIIPAHNEEKTIAEVLRRVLKVDLGEWQKEIIVVNDGSTDKTGKIINKIFGIRPVHHKINLGKGSAIQTGLKTAKGDYVLIQDADLEYFPEDIPKLLLVLSNPFPFDYRSGQALNPSPQQGREIVEVAVFGKRGFKAYPERGFHYVVGAWMLTTCYNLLYGQKLTDLYTGYKLIPSHIFKTLNIQSKGFEFEAEVSCKLAKRGVIIKEVPINYQPRNKDQGKHIRFVDAIKGFWKIIKLRFKLFEQ